jgi:hypothetical protein
MIYCVALYRDVDSGRVRFGVMHRKTAVFYFARCYGKRAATALCNRLNDGAGA